MRRVARVGAAIAAVVLGVLLVLSVGRVRGLMGRELDRAGAPAALVAGSSIVLVEADLLVGDDVTFEVCSDDAMDGARWIGAATIGVEAGASEPRDVVVREPIDAAWLEGARRNSTGACVDLAHAASLEIAGHYVIVARDVTPALDGVAVRGRIVAERPLGAGDRDSVLAILLCAIAIVILLALRAPVETAELGAAWSSGAALGLAGALAVVGVALVGLDPRLSIATKAVLAAVTVVGSVASGLGLRRGSSAAGAMLGVIAVIELSTILSIVTPPGPAFGLAAGLALALSEVVIAAVLARALGAGRHASDALALGRPSRAWVAWAGFAAAPLVGLVLRLIALRLLALVPSTGEAPIEAYVQWPSGLLSFAALSTIAPIGEEIFFRGLVYGSIRGKGGPARELLAFAGAWLLFVVAHLPQTWGSWGGLAAVAMAGLGFTTLRALTGSVLVAALAHLVYNGLLVVAALAVVA